MGRATTGQRCILLSMIVLTGVACSGAPTEATEPTEDIASQITQNRRFVSTPIATLRQLRQAHKFNEEHCAPRTFTWPSTSSAGSIRVGVYGDLCYRDESSALVILDLSAAASLLNSLPPRPDGSSRIVTAGAVLPIGPARSRLSLRPGESAFCLGYLYRATNDVWSRLPESDDWVNQFRNATYELLDPGVGALPVHLPPRAGESLPTSPPAQPGWTFSSQLLEANLTNVMRSWLEQGVPNYGIVFRAPSAVDFDGLGCVADFQRGLIGLTIDID